MRDEGEQKESIAPGVSGLDGLVGAQDEEP